MGGTAWGPLAAYTAAAAGAAYQNYREHHNSTTVTTMPNRKRGPKAIGTTVRYARCDQKTVKKCRYSAQQLLARNYHYFVTRWQTITGGGIMNPYLQLATPSDYSLNLSTVYTGGVGTSMSLPVYAFNLTDPGVAYSLLAPGTEIVQYNVPVYQLNVSNAVTSNNRHYNWSPVTSSHSDPTESNAYTSQYTMGLEAQNVGLNTSGLPYPPLTDQVRHDWTSLNFAIKGAAKYPTKLHFYHVMFDEHSTPLRQYSNIQPQTAAQTLYSYPDAQPINDEHNQEISQFYDHFLCPKIISPLHTYRRPASFKNSIRFLSHHCVTIEPNLSNEADGAAGIAGAGRVLFHNEFYKSGAWLNPRVDLPVTAQPIPASVPPAAGSSATGYNNNSLGILPGAVNPASVRYLMVVAESYNVLATANIAVGNCPTMDVVLRKKHSYGPRGG